MSWRPPYRSSKFRHVYGEAASRERCYDGLRITRGVQDNHCCAVNPQFIAVVTECTGGGAFIVIPVRQTGRVDPHHARVCGHQARVLDVKWDPFDDYRVASCSEDCTVKVWNIPSNGLKENLIFPRKELIGHTHRVGLIEWHPTAKDILLSSAYDYQVCVWRLDGVCCVVKTAVCVIRTHSDLVLSVSFSQDGRAATTCRDRKLRVLNPLTGHLLQVSCSQSHKAWKVLFLTNVNLLLTTGNSQWNHRQYALWNPEDLSNPLLEEDLDGGCGVVFPFYDHDTHMLYLAGKGDCNIRYYDISAEKPYIHFLAEYRSLLPQRGMGVMPKRGVNTRVCEVFRFYRLVPMKDMVEPVSFIVPRKSVGFQEDIYPMTAGAEAAMTAQEWVMGQNRGPVLMSLKPGSKVPNPYPAPVEVAGLDHSDGQVLQDLRESDRSFSQEEMANQHPDNDISDLSGWQEDETQGNGRNNRTSPALTHTQREPTWCESAVCTPATAEKEMLHLFYVQREEIRFLRQQLDQRDGRIQQLELEIKNIRNQLRASF
ncbi:coronin-2B-like [Brachyhypopomus gauderio]|uniref:coronin-2B-like n=1 Tax=Brachyhypopomus gauderio TaxID=698409 RepID=UPI0040426053